MKKDRVILAIDYGLKRVGLAVSRVNLAEPLQVLINDRNLLKNIKDLCNELQVEMIVVGLSEGEMARQTTQFAKQLKAEAGLPIEFMDETLSTQEARQKLNKAKIKQKKKRGPIDHFVAASFLQEWLQLQ
ncbi:MAG: Holliday junction resolvase RuvX [Patescibacteria group bacterium]|nr:Holliday junction resolvase RuvX [Patescibacteria group bacterium]